MRALREHRRRRSTAFAFALAVLGLVLVLYFTLFPFDFVRADGPLTDVVRRFNLTTGPVWHVRELPANLLLFVPFGLGLGGHLHARGRTRRSAIVTCAVSALALSTSVELVQGTWLLRDPSIDDIVANSVGAALGAWLWTRVEPTIDVAVRRLRAAARTRGGRSIVFVLGLLPTTLVLLAALQFRHETDHLGWDSRAPLALGNEPTGDRPWDGSLAQVSIADRRLTQEESSAWLSGSQMRDLAPESTVLDLDFSDPSAIPTDWQLRPAEASDRDLFVDDRLELGPTRWLQTIDPPNEIARRINDSGAFTLAADAATTSSDQTGPARLISFSIDPLHRNLTVAQDGTDLVVRVRSDFTGPNGAYPEFTVPGVFSDERSHRFVITYDASSIAVVLADPDRTTSIRLLPTAVPMIETFTDEIPRVRFSALGNLARGAFLSAFMFAPWSVCVALLRRGCRRRLRTALLIIAPVPIAEVLLTRILPFHAFRLVYVLVVSLAALLVAALVASTTCDRSAVHRVGPPA